MVASPQPFFLQGSRGKLFALHFPPQKDNRAGKHVLFVPPFAEEMNKARRMVAVLSRELSQRGIGVLVLDLFGTGDSEGDFADARWEIWQDDLSRALQWLREGTGEEIVLLGLRLGALLAMELVAKETKGVSSVILWQPISDGKRAMTQFLRLRTAESMMDSAKEKESIEQLRNAIANGEAVEVAGYTIASALFTALERVDLRLMATPDFPSIHWFELSADPTPTLLVSSTQIIATWRRRGIGVSARAVCGQPFWTGHATTVIPDLLNVTTDTILETNSNESRNGISLCEWQRETSGHSASSR